MSKENQTPPDPLLYPPAELQENFIYQYQIQRLSTVQIFRKGKLFFSRESTNYGRTFKKWMPSPAKQSLIHKDNAIFIDPYCNGFSINEFILLENTGNKARIRKSNEEN